MPSFSITPRQHDRAGGRRLGVCVGQPRVQREERDLDSERDGEREEQPTSGRGGEVGTLGDLDEIERDTTEIVAGDPCRCDEAHQHERRTEHRVEEELRRCVLAALVAPPADEEVHRHEHDLEEDEEEEQVEAEERPHHAGLQHQHPGEIRLLVMMRIDAGDHDRKQQSGQDHHEQRDAVDAEVPADSPLLDPRVLGHELESAVGGLERGEQPDAHRGRDDRREQCDQLRELGTRSCGEQHTERARDRHEDQCRENRKGARCATCRQHHRIPRITTNHVSSSTTPTPMIAAY